MTGNPAATGATGDDKGKAPQTQHSGGKTEHMIPKARFDQVIQQKKDAEKALEDVCNELLEEVPEDMRDLIPDLSPGGKITWIRNAVKKGIFVKKQLSGPDSKRPPGRPPEDLEGLSPTAKMARGYKT